jgi:hypothetical protein
MNGDFCSKVAERLGGCSSGVKRTTLCPEGDPEALGRRWEGAPVSRDERARLERAGATVLREQYAEAASEEHRIRMGRHGSVPHARRGDR